MTDLHKAAQQALEALEWHYRQGHSNTLGGLRLKIDEKALRNLRAALAQQAEPKGGGNLPPPLQAEPVQEPDHTYKLIGCVQHDCEECQRRSHQSKGQHMTLPPDVARCLGTDLPECTTCRRRTDPPHERQVWTGPWELEGVPCEMRIPSDQNRTQSVKDRGHAGAVGSRPAHDSRVV